MVILYALLQAVIISIVIIIAICILILLIKRKFKKRNLRPEGRKFKPPETSERSYFVVFWIYENSEIFVHSRALAKNAL